MKLTIDHEPGLLVARIQGRFDAHTVGSFGERVIEGIGPDRRNVVVELAGVEFMDSSALAALVTTLKRTMEHGGEVVLAGMSDAARIILELTRLDQVFTHAPTIDAARLELAAAGTGGR